MDTLIGSPYPKALAGKYEINFTELILTPVQIPSPCETKLTEIKFQDGVGNAFFEDGFVIALNVKYDQNENHYTFLYNQIQYVFAVQASLGGLHRLMDVDVLIDFGALARGQG